MSSQTTQSKLSARTQALQNKLLAYAKNSNASALSVGVGIVGLVPFAATLIGVAIIFLASTALAVQPSARQSASTQQNFFTAIMVGAAFTVFGIILSLVNISDVMMVMRIAAEEDGGGLIRFLGPQETALEMTGDIRASQKQLAEGLNDLAARREKEREKETVVAASREKEREKETEKPKETPDLAARREKEREREKEARSEPFTFGAN